MPPIRIEATYRVVTPLFCAGADSKTPELRLSSFKGVLCYWWRALAWSRYGADLGAIGRQEDRLFGSADGGQSRVVMRLESTPESPKISVGEVLEVHAGAGVVGEGARYLGYGVMEAFARQNKRTGERIRPGQLTRSCLGAPFDFAVQIRARDLHEKESTSLVEALVALGVLGGLGARSRKGYGSLVLRSLLVNGEARWSTPRSMDELQRAIAGLRSEQTDDRAGAYPEFTALSNRARHVLLSSTRREPLDLLDLVGREMVRFRSWGRKGKILGGQVDSERKFRIDHDLMKRHERRSHPQRIAFGLPHNYGGHKHEKVGPADGLDRRASPLFIHIHICDDGPVAVLSFLPARFLPAGRSDVSVGGSRVPQVPEAELYRPIHDFLDRLLDGDRRREPFAGAVEVRP